MRSLRLGILKDLKEAFLQVLLVNDGLLLGEAVIWSYKRLLLFLLEVVGGLL